MKYDVIPRAVWLGLLAGLLSQSLGCASIIWDNTHPLRISHKFVMPDEALVASDGCIALRFHDLGDSGEVRYVMFSGDQFQDALRAHIGLATKKEVKFQNAVRARQELAPSQKVVGDGALPWDSRLTVMLNLRGAREQYEQYMFREDYGFKMANDVSWSDLSTTVRYDATSPIPVIFPYNLDGVTYQIAVEFDSEDIYSPAWVYPVYVPCAAVDIVTLPLQAGVVVLGCLVYFGASIPG